MMATYRTRGHFFGADYGEACTANEVILEEQSDWIDTGLVDERGEPIQRRRETVPFGFVSAQARS